jgi:membrane protease YdiL (CAAX protease family)
MVPDTSAPEPVLRRSVDALPGRPLDDHVAAGLRGFGPLGLLAVVLILLTGNVFVGNMIVLPIGATLSLLWAWRSRTPWREMGYVRPRSWAVTLIVGVVFGVALKFAMKAIVMPLLGADPVNQAFRFLTGNTALLPAAVWSMFVAGFGEETVFRGFMFERLGKLLGTGAAAKAFAVLATSAWFGLAHYAGQGLPGVQQATIVGFLFGSIFAVTGRLWMLMVAHTAFDLTALAMIYWNLETAVARFVFK